MLLWRAWVWDFGTQLCWSTVGTKDILELQLSLWKWSKNFYSPLFQDDEITQRLKLNCNCSTRLVFTAPRLHACKQPTAAATGKTACMRQSLWPDLELDARESESTSRPISYNEQLLYISEDGDSWHIMRPIMYKHFWCWMVKRPVVLFPARFPYSLLISCFPWLDSAREATLTSCYVKTGWIFLL